jgi:hypothetical protein
MADPERVGYEEWSERDLFVLAVDTPEEIPARVTLSSARFVCLLAWDARGVDVERVGRVARALLDSGAVVVCTWGPDCERVHDIFDWEELGPDPAAQPRRGGSPEAIVLTSWHDGASLADTVYFVLSSSSPCPEYREGCGATLGVSIGSAAWAAEIRAAFADPQALMDRMIGEV